MRGFFMSVKFVVSLVWRSDFIVLSTRHLIFGIFVLLLLFLCQKNAKVVLGVIKLLKLKVFISWHIDCYLQLGFK